MWGFNIFEAMIDFIKFKGFKEEPFKRKMEWLVKYPVVALVVGIVIAEAILESVLSFLYKLFKKHK